MTLTGWFSLENCYTNGFVVYKTMDGAHVVLSQVSSHTPPTFPEMKDGVVFGQVTDCVVGSRTLRYKHRHFRHEKQEYIRKGPLFKEFNKSMAAELTIKIKEAGLEPTPLPPLPKTLIIEEDEEFQIPPDVVLLDMATVLPDEEEMVEYHGHDPNAPDPKKDRLEAIAYLKMVIMRDHGLDVIVPDSLEDASPCYTAS